MTSNSRTEEVLYESEAALRLVDQEIHELCGVISPEHRYAASGVDDLPNRLEQANTLILQVLADVQATRSSLQLQEVTSLQIRQAAVALMEMESRLREVTRLCAVGPQIDRSPEDGQGLTDEVFTASPLR